MSEPRETKGFLNSPTSSDESTPLAFGDSSSRRGHPNQRSLGSGAFAVATGASVKSAALVADGVQQLRRENTASVQSNLSVSEMERERIGRSQVHHSQLTRELLN